MFDRLVQPLIGGIYTAEEKLLSLAATMPQYHVGHLDHVAEINRRTEQWRCLQLPGSGIHGVGVPSCIKSGREAASRILNVLNSRLPALSQAT